MARTAKMTWEARQAKTNFKRLPFGSICIEKLLQGDMSAGRADVTNTPELKTRRGIGIV
jgi:hypothetical protein